MRLGMLVIALLALTGPACGSDERENDLRPPLPGSVSVNVTTDGVTVSPRAVAFGAERGREAAEDGSTEGLRDPSSEPMPVEITVANTVDRPLRLALIGPTRHISEDITGRGTGVVSLDLESGRYEVRAFGLGPIESGRLVVGPTRVSPQNDLMLP